jgi:hypothetical protein
MNKSVHADTGPALALNADAVGAAMRALLLPIGKSAEFICRTMTAA